MIRLFLQEPGFEARRHQTFATIAEARKAANSTWYRGYPGGWSRHQQQETVWWERGNEQELDAVVWDAKHDDGMRAIHGSWLFGPTEGE